MDRLLLLLLLLVLLAGNGNVASSAMESWTEAGELLDDEFEISDRQDYQQVDPRPKLESPVQPGPVEHIKPLPPFSSTSHTPPSRSPPPSSPSAAAAPPPTPPPRRTPAPPPKLTDPTVPIAPSSSPFTPSPSGGSTIITPPP